MEWLEKKKAECDQYLDEQMEALWSVSKYIHANPELNFEEVKACKVQCEFLERYGFSVKKGIGTLDTAFEASYSKTSSGPVIAIISEYDALPIGHACGHNLIACSALGAAIELKKYMEETETAGTLKVIGTPAEEGGGGKIILIKQGIFEGVDAVLMMHPTSDTTRLAGACLSSKRYKVTYHGVSAHAGSHPDNGTSALSAAALFLSGSGLLRQHFKGDWRLSGIITKGGYSTGLIPETSEVEGSMSCFSLKELNTLANRVADCAKGCGQAMGCRTEVEIADGYEGRIPNRILSDVCRGEFEKLGEPLMDGMPVDFGGEDLGNVSRLIPICNPYMTIFPDYKISNHTEQFRDLAVSEAGVRCIRQSSKAMARTAMELLNRPALLEQAKEELRERLQKE